MSRVIYCAIENTVYITKFLRCHGNLGRVRRINLGATFSLDHIYIYIYI